MFFVMFKFLNVEDIMSCLFCLNWVSNLLFVFIVSGKMLSFFSNWLFSVFFFVMFLFESIVVSCIGDIMMVILFFFII